MSPWGVQANHRFGCLGFVLSDIKDSRDPRTVWRLWLHHSSFCMKYQNSFVPQYWTLVCDVYVSEVVQCDYEGQAGILVCAENWVSVALLLKIKYCLDNLLPQLFRKELISRLVDFLTWSYCVRSGSSGAVSILVACDYLCSITVWSISSCTVFEHQHSLYLHRKRCNRSVVKLL